MLARSALRRLLPALACGVAVLTLSTSPLAAPAEPVFADLSGGRVRLSERPAELRLVNFWATWCAPCRSEMPVITALHEEFGRRGLVVIGISANGLDESEVVRAAMAAMDMRFEVWLWANADDLAVYGVGPRLPATLLLDRQGRVLHRFGRVVTLDELRPLIEGLLPAGNAGP